MGVRVSVCACVHSCGSVDVGGYVFLYGCGCTRTFVCVCVCVCVCV